MKRRDFIAVLGGAAWPLAARAQEQMPLVGFLYLGDRFGNLLTFRRGLAEAGFVEGKNVRFEFHGSASNARLPAVAVELAVIVATGSPPAVLVARAVDPQAAERIDHCGIRRRRQGQRQGLLGAHAPS
jgi:putative tryptophan/tyrosine transport system substrate-binding protein